MPPLTTGSSGSCMASGDSVDDVIRRIVELLDAARIPYMLTGSFASSLHGAPRATQDINLVIALDSASLEALLNNFPDDQYYVSREAAFDAYQRRSLFNVIDFATGWKISRRVFQSLARLGFGAAPLCLQVKPCHPIFDIGSVQILALDANDPGCILNLTLRVRKLRPLQFRQ